MRKDAIPALTGIRFYAALLVFLSHAPIVGNMESWVGSHLIFNAGVVGVSFFFVLSGFILTYNYADVFKDGISRASYQRFVWDRFTKIYPVHLLALLIVLPIAIKSPNLPFKWSALPVHLLLLQCFWPTASSTFYNYLNVPSWSISCEWFFYLLAPFAIFAFVARQRRYLVVLLTVCYVGLMALLISRGSSDFARLYFVSWFAPSRFIEFVCGVVLGSSFLRDRFSLPSGWLLPLQLAGVALIAAGANYRHVAPWPLWGGLLYLPGSMLLVISLAKGSTVLTEHLGGEFVQRLGGASFSFYLLHAPILRAIKGIFMIKGWTIGTWPALMITMLALFVTIQCIALLVFEKFEIPVQRRLRQMLRSRRPVEPQTIEPAISRGTSASA